MSDKKHRDQQHPGTDGDFAVGYRKPPRGSRFTKGKSGNPKGRPVGSKNLRDLFEDALNEQVTVNENGRRRMISKREAISAQLVNKAASGDARSIKLVVDLLRNAAGRDEVSPQQTPLDEDDLAVMNDLIRELKEVGVTGDGGGDDDDDGSDPKAL
jgi:hypothetical protein